MEKRRIKDLHCHIMEPYSLCPIEDFVQPQLENAEQIGRILQECGLEGLAIPAISLYEEPDFACNALSLYAKLLYPQKVYALAGIRRYAVREENQDMLFRARKLIEAGFDGFKMICKPNARRVLQFEICDKIFDEFYEAAQEEQWPILFHVGDPPEFWNQEKVPRWALKNGWYYGGEEGLPSYEDLYRETEIVLERFPKLRITFAHFFFCSHRLDYAGRLLDTYPNICFDITPGSEMYLDFADRPEEAGAFFEKYRDRILFGTDNVAVPGEKAEANLEASRAKLAWMTRFLETKEEQVIEGMTVRGLGLSEDVLEHIYEKNFDAFFHNRLPAEVKPDLCAKLAGDMRLQMKGETGPAVETKKLLEKLEAVFREWA